jgi:hypothetical protein
MVCPWQLRDIVVLSSLIVSRILLLGKKCETQQPWQGIPKVRRQALALLHKEAIVLVGTEERSEENPRVKVAFIESILKSYLF